MDPPSQSPSSASRRTSRVPEANDAILSRSGREASTILQSPVNRSRHSHGMSLFSNNSYNTALYNGSYGTASNNSDSNGGLIGESPMIPGFEDEDPNCFVPNVPNVPNAQNVDHSTGSGSKPHEPFTDNLQKLGIAAQALETIFMNDRKSAYNSLDHFNDEINGQLQHQRLIHPGQSLQPHHPGQPQQFLPDNMISRAGNEFMINLQESSKDMLMNSNENNSNKDMFRLNLGAGGISSGDMAANTGGASTSSTVLTSSLLCADCGLQFLDSNKLRRHQKVEHHRRTFKCRKCGELFRSIADRQTHKNNKHFSNISIAVKKQNFKEFPLGTVVASSRNSAGYFNCPSGYCSFVTRIPGYWYEHIHTVEHAGVDPQRRKRRKSMNV